MSLFSRILITCFCLFVWCVIGWRMHIAQLFLGQIPLMDFDIYYHTAVDVRHGVSPLTVSYMQTSGPPSVLLFYLPFSFFSLGVARAVMSVLSMIALFTTSMVLVRTVWKRHIWFFSIVLSTLFLLSFPVRFTIQQGQSNLVLMMLVTYLLFTSNTILSGILMSIVCVIKTQYCIALCIWWNSKKIVITMLGILCIILLGFVFLVPQYYKEFFTTRFIGAISQQAELHDVDYYNQSLKSTMGRFGLSSIYQPILVFLCIFAVGYMVTHPGNIGVGIVFSFLLSPLVWQHYVVVLYPLLFCALFQKSGKHQITIRVLAIVSIILLSLHIPGLHGKPLLFPYTLFASHFFLGILSVLGIQLLKK